MHGFILGGATCPNCGQLLWFFQSPEMLTLFDERQTGTLTDRPAVWSPGLSVVMSPSLGVFVRNLNRVPIPFQLAA